MEPVSDPDNPADESPTVAAEDLEGTRGNGQFRVRPAAVIQCLTCRFEFDAHTVDADRLARLEGASDPADEMMLVALTCPNCGTSGSLSLGYGPQATPEEGDVLRAIERTNGHGG